MASVTPPARETLLARIARLEGRIAALENALDRRSRELRLLQATLCPADLVQLARMATDLGPQAHVLETDAPDISPAWLHPGRNEPSQLARIADGLPPLPQIAHQLEYWTETTVITSAEVEATLADLWASLTPSPDAPALAPRVPASPWPERAEGEPAHDGTETSE